MILYSLLWFTRHTYPSPRNGSYWPPWASLVRKPKAVSIVANILWSKITREIIADDRGLFKTERYNGFCTSCVTGNWDHMCEVQSYLAGEFVTCQWARRKEHNPHTGNFGGSKNIALVRLLEYWYLRWFSTLWKSPVVCRMHNTIVSFSRVISVIFFIAINFCNLLTPLIWA